MDGNGYRGGPTVEGRWGCIAAAFVGVPLWMALTFIDALGDCVPGTACGKSVLIHVLLPTAVVAIAVGLVVRWGIRLVRRRNRR